MRVVMIAGILGCLAWFGLKSTEVTACYALVGDMSYCLHRM